jgi:hypothetical protein
MSFEAKHQRDRVTAAEFAARAAEIVDIVTTRAAAGDRTAMRLCREHGLPFGPSPELLAARLAESIERTRATVAALLAEGGLGGTRQFRAVYAGRPDRPAGPKVIALADAKTRRRTGAPRCGAANNEVALVKNNENTSAAADAMQQAGGGEVKMSGPPSQFGR